MLLEVLRQELLPRVNKPGQYLGNEFGAVHKDWDSAKSRMALIYPDLYELGMSNYGLKILYNIVNKHPDYLCDRAFAPMQDMEALLRERDLPLWAWESSRPLSEFDMLGFSLAYELCYTSVLNILDLAKVPVRSKDRNATHPLVFAGGPAVFNPEPMADFIDFYLIGDGEELIIEIQDSLLASRKNFLSEHTGPLDEKLAKEFRKQLLLDLSKLRGVYVPAFYEVDIGPISKADINYLPQAKPDIDVPKQIYKRVTQFLDDSNQASSGPVPHISTVQDKQVMEIRRGCDRGCRFCQVGYTYLPVRERSPEDLLRLSKEAIANTGYDSYTLLSLSASDYTCLTEAARALNNEHATHGISMSMPSQRADRFNVDLAAEISQVRKSGMTFAPEAGTERMRKIINKGLSQEDIYKAIRGSYEAGWSHIKLYFMIGLPFEEDEDLDGILDILSWSVNMAKQLRKTNPDAYPKPLDITCTISTFVPKPFTAFQWFAQCSTEEFKRKQNHLMQGLRARNLHRSVKLNCTEPDIALLEAVMSRGDRRLGALIEAVWRSGSRLDAWSENFNIVTWRKQAQICGLDLEQEASKHREPGSKQPWDIISIGFEENFLLKEWQQALEAKETIPCTENKCHACGVCFKLDVKNVVTEKQTTINPFVIEIDKDKRQASCASLGPPADPVAENLKPQAPKQKLRLIITKLDDLRFVGHLDFQRLVERAIRRSGLPVIHTQGYNQRMKLIWGPALPLFLESKWEYIEIELAQSFDNIEKIPEILNKQLPKQARIKSVELLSPGNLDDKSINNVKETVYTASTQSLAISRDMVNDFLSRDSIEIEKEVKARIQKKNIREQVFAMKLLNSQTIELGLKSTQRVDEVLGAFIPGAVWKACKEYQVLA
jgi:radical SAM family uncharacterized protein/radical SAM-linked protein